MALREQRFTLWVVLLLLASFLVSTDAIAATNLHDPSGSFTGLLDLVKNSAQQWDGKLKGYAERLFWMLALIQFIWTFMPLVFKQADLGEIVGELMRFILVIGFFWALLQFASEWAEAVVNSFRQAGASAAGLGETAIRPGDIFGTAIELANTIGDVETWNPLTAFMVALAGVLVLLCFAFIAAFMGLTIIESYVVINASVLFMGFGASQWTREYAMAIVRYAVSVGAKLFILTLIVGLITDSAKQWQAAYNHDDASMWTMIGLAFACAYFAKTIPELVAGMISGVSAGGGSSIGGMAAAGAAGAAAAIATIATAGAAAPAAAGVMGAAGAGSAGAAGAAGAGAVGTGGLAGAINSSFAGASSAGGAASSAGSAASAGVGTSTGGSAAAKGASSAGSRVGGSAANSAPSAAPAQPSSGVQQAAKQAGKAAQGGDDDKSQAAPGSASQQGATASSGDSSASSSAPASSADTASGDAGSADSSAGGKGVSGRQVAEGVTRGLGLMSAIAVPGMESAAGLSLGAGQPQPTPDGGNGDAPSMAPSSNSEPENVIRPADPVPPSDGGPKPGTKGED
ncbi:P-type conjugative transfer protein TrbL [Escherichia coli]|uniref:P-type conjugative transfer protein TrbL n=1 Tax=Escherichia coli TaxID=562 RepID=UPI00101227A8|nr:P-type conjugative transfer protein TrbL [Escherichia coli]MCV1805266.1 P-type conjugative transfer protein TrbL [Escherichia coli]RXP68897.1 P-type conjugative transfer protein TrbL [Escherichia coli]HBP0871523.1 P-type conjugative transfer protein TrbL [Pseudomonas aeruginosa]HCM9335767.1 P-type conjugative transfer protein TrbL [Enterobacter asburiae]